MKVWHLIPTSEAELHEADCFCLCEPVVLTESKKQVECLQNYPCFEHIPFSPLEREEQDQNDNYSMLAFLV